MSNPTPKAPGDAFATITLHEPIHVDGTVYSELRFPAPTAGILAHAGGNPDYGTTMQIVAEWAGVPRKVCDQLDPDAGHEAAVLVNRCLEPLSEVLGGEDAFDERVELPVTLELDDPVEIGSRTVERLTCERVIAGHLIGIPAQGATVGHFLKLGAKIFAEPPSTINRLSPRDAARVLRIALHFFARFQGT